MASNRLLNSFKPTMAVRSDFAWGAIWVLTFRQLRSQRRRWGAIQHQIGCLPFAGGEREPHHFDGGEERFWLWEFVDLRGARWVCRSDRWSLGSELHGERWEEKHCRRWPMNWRCMNWEGTRVKSLLWLPLYQVFLKTSFSLDLHWSAFVLILG